jgi:hypothetical protein
MAKMNWNQGKGMDPVDEGSYEVKILDYKWGESLKGNPKIDWESVIVGPDGSPFIGRHLWEVTTITDKALWRLAWFVAEAGIDTAELKEMDTKSEEFKRVLQACKGRRMWWTVTIDAYEGKTRNKVSEYAQVADQAPITAKDLDDVPEFLKHKGGTGGGENAPF